MKILDMKNTWNDNLICNYICIPYLQEFSIRCIVVINTISDTSISGRMYLLQRLVMSKLFSSAGDISLKKAK